MELRATLGKLLSYAPWSGLAPAGSAS
jgi:hypothetical protein